MVGEDEIFSLGNFLLEALDLGIFKLNDPAAMDTNQMVMVGPFHHSFVIFLSPSKVVFLNHLLLGQEMERPIDCGLGDALVFLAKRIPQFIR